MFFILLAVQIVFYASAVLKFNSSIAFSTLYGALGLAFSAFMFVYYTNRNLVYTHVVPQKQHVSDPVHLMFSSRHKHKASTKTGSPSSNQTNSFWDCSFLDCSFGDCATYFDCAALDLPHLDCAGADCAGADCAGADCAGADCDCNV